MSVIAKAAMTGARECELVDVLAGTTVRFVVHGDSIYIESVQRHEGTPVANLARVPLDLALPVLRALVLSPGGAT